VRRRHPRPRPARRQGHASQRLGTRPSGPTWNPNGRRRWQPFFLRCKLHPGFLPPLSRPCGWATTSSTMPLRVESPACTGMALNGCVNGISARLHCLARTGGGGWLARLSRYVRSQNPGWCNHHLIRGHTYCPDFILGRRSYDQHDRRCRPGLGLAIPHTRSDCKQ
jgi:hypothetical protein